MGRHHAGSGVVIEHHMESHTRKQFTLANGVSNAGLVLAGF